MHSTQAPPPPRTFPEFFFAGAEREAICQALILDLLAGRPLLCLTGEPGAGKTLLCRALMERLPEEWIPVYLENPAASAEALFRQVCIHLGASGDSKSPDFAWYREFERQLQAQIDAGRKVVLILDPAEDPRFAAPLDLLFRRCPASAPDGAPPLTALLTGADLSPILRQLAMLDAGHTPDKTYALAPMTLAETEEYLDCLLRVSGLSGLTRAESDEPDEPAGRMDAAAIFEQAAGNYRKTNLAAAEALADIMPTPDQPAPAPAPRQEAPDIPRPARRQTGQIAPVAPRRARRAQRSSPPPRRFAQTAERILLRLYTQLMADKLMTAGLLALACFFCVLGLALMKQGAPPDPPPPANPETDAETPLLKEHRAAGTALVAASYRGAYTIRLALVSGGDAATRIQTLLDNPALRHDAGRLYLVGREAGPATPATYCLFQGIFPNVDEARQALAALPDNVPEIRDAHPLPAAEALRCAERWP